MNKIRDSRKGAWATTLSKIQILILRVVHPISKKSIRLPVLKNGCIKSSLRKKAVISFLFRHHPLALSQKLLVSFLVALTDRQGI